MIISRIPVFPGFSEFYCADRTHNEKETETDKYRNDQQIIPAERIRNKFLCRISDLLQAVRRNGPHKTAAAVMTITIQKHWRCSSSNVLTL